VEVTGVDSRKLKLAVDGGAATESTFNWSGCATGADIAAQMQSVIQALGGAFSAVTVDYNVTAAGKYAITSGTKGTNSAVVVTAGTSPEDCADNLKLGTAHSGVEASGVDKKTLKLSLDSGTATPVTFDWTATSGCDSGSKIAAQMQLKIRALGGAFSAIGVAYDGGSGKYTITGTTTGSGKSVVVTNGDTFDCAAILLLGAGNTGAETVGVDAAHTNLKVSVDGSAATPISVTFTGCNTGAAIATALQGAISAIFTGVTVAWGAGVYTINSGTYGTGSHVIVTPGDTLDCADDLKLGTANTGVETAGTGDAVNLAAATPAECAAKLAALVGLTAIVEPATNKLRITSDVPGMASSLVVNAASTLDTVFGITGSDYGAPDTYNVTTAQVGKVLVYNSAGHKTFNLPSVAAGDVGTWYTFKKSGAGNVVIQAADADIIIDSAAGGTLTNSTAAETYATVMLVLVDATHWASQGGSGTWVAS
jgi:hypothetical protein